MFNSVILIPSYFSPISQYVACLKAESVLFEIEDNFQKQTYRNRCYIMVTNGRQMLNIPVKHHNASRKTHDVLIDHSMNWQKVHLKSLQTAYRASPYFEFYEDSIQHIYESNHKYLLDLNLYCHEQLTSLLNLTIPIVKTKEYHKKYTDITDLRSLADAKLELQFGFEPYFQVFSAKQGFIENLSILDLLFMEGPNAVDYLKRQTLKL